VNFHELASAVIKVTHDRALDHAKFDDPTEVHVHPREFPGLLITLPPILAEGARQGRPVTILGAALVEDQTAPYGHARLVFGPNETVLTEVAS
jgi:hypothetical protein